MLTPAQQLIVKNYVMADATLNALPPSADSAFAIADALAVDFAPAFIVWRSSTSRQSILQNGFDWTRLDNLSIGKARIWADIFVDGNINASKPNVRAGIEAVWVGTAPDLAVRAVVYGHCKRSATVLEKILAAGTGSDASPATMGFEGRVAYNEVQTAMGWI